MKDEARRAALVTLSLRHRYASRSSKSHDGCLGNCFTETVQVRHSSQARTGTTPGVLGGSLGRAAGSSRPGSCRLPEGQSQTSHKWVTGALRAKPLRALVPALGGLDVDLGLPGQQLERVLRRAHIRAISQSGQRLAIG